MSLLLTLNIFHIYSKVFIVDFEQVNLLEMVILKMLLYCLILKFIPLLLILFFGDWGCHGNFIDLLEIWFHTFLSIIF